MNNIEKITKVVLAFKPHIEEQGRPIRLADVIRAGAGSLAPDQWEEFKPAVVDAWNCDVDNLSKQSDETIDKIAGLLP